MSFNGSVVDWLVHSTLVLVTVCALDRLCLRTASAAVRHRSLSCGFTALLLIPLLNQVLPKLSVPVLPQMISAQPSASEFNTIASSSDQPVVGKMHRQISSLETYTIGETAITSDSVHDASVKTLNDAVSVRNDELSVSEAIPIASANARQAFTFDFLQVIKLIWCTGVFVAFVPLLSGLFQVRAMLRHCRPVGTGPTHNIFNEVQTLLGLGHRTLLYASQYAIMPMVWGIFRPSVIVPAELVDWPVERQRLVFMHELSHVQRQDVFYQIVARLACCIYWFHPLAWYAMHRLRVERELACDDCVLSHANQPCNYAEHLVTIAKQYHSRCPFPAMAMAHQSGLEQRIVAILDRSRSHTLLKPGMGRVLLFSSLAMTTALCCVRLEAGDTTQDNSDRLVEKPVKYIDKSLVKMTGRVVSSEQEPISGARVVLKLETMKASFKERPVPKFEKLGETTTDSAGQYSFDVPTWLGEMKEGPQIQLKIASIEVTADGFGPMGKEYYQGDLNNSIELKPAKIPILGRIIDEQGQPLKDVKVRVLQIQEIAEPVAKHIEDAQRNPAEERRPPNGRRFHHLPTGNGIGFNLNSPNEFDLNLPSSTTDADGRFRLDGIGDDRLVRMEVAGRQISTIWLQAVTRVMAPANAPANSPFMDTGKYYGNEFEYVAKKSQVVRGTIRDKFSGNPIAGARVCFSYDRSFFAQNIVTSTTDQFGRFELLGVPKLRPNAQLVVYSPPNEPYFHSRHDIPTTNDLDPIDLDLELRRGIWIEGRATETGSGQPVSASVQYLPYRSNPNAKYHEFSRGWMQQSFPVDDQGRFRVPGLVGAGLLKVVADRADDYEREFNGLEGKAYIRQMSEAVIDFQDPGNAVVELRIAEGSSSVKANVEIRPRDGMDVKVVDENGNDLSNYMVAGTAPVSPPFGGVVRYWQPDPVLDSRFTVFFNDKYRPGVTSEVDESRPPITILHKRLGLGTVVDYETLENSADKDRIVTLRPCGKIIGRIKSGENILDLGARSLRIWLDCKQSQQDFPVSRNVISQNVYLQYDGSFSVSIPADAPYSMAMETRGVSKEVSLFSAMKVGPGEVIDIGEIDIEVDATAWPAHVRRKLAPKQSLHIKVVDARGNPLKGAQIFGTLERRSWQQLSSDEVEIDDYHADQPRDLYFYDPATDQAGYLHLEGSVQNVQSITLNKSTKIEGRLVDQGQPMAGVWVRGEGVPWNFREGTHSDSEGKFILRGLIPGRTYQLFGQVGSRGGNNLVPLRELKIGVSPTQSVGDVVVTIVKPE